MSERLCTSCMKGKLVDLEVGAVCTHCHRVFTPAEAAPLPDLTNLLAFAAHRPHASAVQIREAFGISELRYVAALNRALDTPEAFALQPTYVTAARERRDRFEAIRRGAA